MTGYDVMTCLAQLCRFSFLISCLSSHIPRFQFQVVPAWGAGWLTGWLYGKKAAGEI